MYAALVGLIGASLFVLLLLRRLRALGLGSDQFAEDAADRARRLALVGAWVLVLATPARLIAQAVSVDVERLDGARRDHGGAPGWRRWPGAVAALAALLGARQVAVRRWRIAGAGAVLVAAGFAFSGHAAVGDRISRSLSIAADIVHLLAAGAWVGTLAAVALAGIPAAMRAPEGARGAIAAALVNVFSPLALVSAGALAVTGTFAAWEHIGGIGALLHTDYGQALLWKLGAVAVVAAIGAVNWRLLAPEARIRGGGARHPALRDPRARRRAARHPHHRRARRQAHARRDGGSRGAPRRALTTALLTQ